MSSPYGYSPPGYGQSHNPYAAPQAFGAPGYGPMGGAPMGPVAFKAHGTGLKWAYLASLLGGYGIMLVGGCIIGAGEDEVGAGILLFGMVLAVFLRLVFALIWLYGAWDAVPHDYRVTASGKRVSPGEAVGFLFIPLFNIYWMFIASGGLCDAYDFMLRSSGVHRAAPKGTALGACISQLIPYINMLVGPFVWFAYMLQVDNTAAALEAASASAASGAGGAPVGFGGHAPAAAGYGPPAGGYGGPPPGGYGGGYGA